MAIVVENKHGWVLDQQSAWRKVVSGCYGDCHFQACGNNTLSKMPQFCYQFLAASFEIHHPFMMDSQFQKLIKKKNADKSPSPETSSPRKKRRISSNSDSTPTKDDDTRILEERLASLLGAARQVGYLLPQSDLPNDNNVSARAAAQTPGPGESLRQLCMKVASVDSSSSHIPQPLQLNLSHLIREDPAAGSEYCLRLPGSIINQCVVHSGCHTALVRFLNENYCLPAHSAFVLSDFHQLVNNPEPLNVPGGYDVIVVDPPWHNKSVIRKHSYSSLTVDELEQLPVRKLCGPRCLVVVWITNNPDLQELIKSRLMPAWGVQFCTKWTWIKLTTSGELIVDFSAPKKPFEVLLIGQVGKDAAEWPEHLSNKILVSVPCSLHSSKPNLAEILRPVLPASSKCLEMFARNLWSGWTSWGNEVLKYQHEDFYEELKFLD